MTNLTTNAISEIFSEGEIRTWSESSKIFGMETRYKWKTKNLGCFKATYLIVQDTNVILRLLEFPSPSPVVCPQTN